MEGSSTSRCVYLVVVRISERLCELIPIGLVFTDVMTKEGSIVLLWRSACLLVCGWLEVVVLRRIPRIWQNDFQNTATSCGPLSERIVFGMPQGRIQ